MNKLELTFPGKMPLVQEDLKFMQDAYSEAIKGLLSAFELQSDTFIISGMIYSGGGGSPSTFSEGWLCLNGEVLYSPAITVNVALSNVKVGVFETTVAPSPKTFKDLSVRNVNLRRIVNIGLIGGGAPLYTSLLRLEDGIGNKLSLVKQEGCSLGANMTGAVIANKNKIGHVTLSGQVRSSQAGSQIVFTLPAGFRPSSQRRFPIVLLFVANQAAFCIVNTNGQVEVQIDIANRDYYFDNVQFYV
jgi:hypothetical protein